MRKNDIRFNGKAATIEHHSARGKITRNSGNFTRGSQLISHEIMMTWAGIRIPLLIWLFTFVPAITITMSIMMKDHETGLVLMRLYSSVWSMMDLDPGKIINLTLPNGSLRTMIISAVPYSPAVDHAWDKAVRCFFGSAFISMFIAIPLTIWFIDISNRRGKAILTERHERGAMLVEAPILNEEVRAHNYQMFKLQCEEMTPPLSVNEAKALSSIDRAKLNIHRPYLIAGIPYPWMLEQSHAMFVGTTGSGKCDGPGAMAFGKRICTRAIPLMASN